MSLKDGQDRGGGLSGNDVVSRANKVSVDMLNTTEAGSSRFDEGVNLYQCRDCGKRQINIMVFAGLKIYHTEQVKRYMTGEDWPAERKCDCGRRMGAEDLEARLYNRYLPEQDLTLQARVVTAQEGEGPPAIEYLKVDRHGVGALGGRMDHDVMVKAFGKSVNVKESWWSLIISVLDSKKVRGLTLEDGYHIGLIPPYDTEEEMMKEVHDMMGSFPKATRPVIEHLSNLEKNNLPFYEETYHEWTDDAERFFADGTFGTVVMLDLARLHGWVQWDLKRRDIEFEQDPMDDLIYSVRKGEFYETLDLRDTTLEGIHKALTFYEMTTRAVDRAIDYFHDAENFLKNLKKELSGFDFKVQGHMLLIKDPKGREQEINIHTMPRKVGYDGEGFDNYVNFVRGMFSGKASTMDMCECGLPTYVTKIVKPKDWPSVSLPPEYEGTDKDPRVNMLAEDTGTYKVVYSLDCKHHSKFMNRSELERWGLTMEQLEERWEKDLDKNFYHVGVYFMGTSTDKVVALVGHGVASLAVSPALVLGALKVADVSFSTNEVTATANHTDVLVLTPKGTPETYTRHMEQRASEIHAQNMGERGTPLELRVELVLEGPARGNFELEEAIEI